jgi:uncharacterized membrane protein YfcA
MHRLGFSLENLDGAPDCSPLPFGGGGSGKLAAGAGGLRHPEDRDPSTKDKAWSASPSDRASPVGVPAGLLAWPARTLSRPDVASRLILLLGLAAAAAAAALIPLAGHAANTMLLMAAIFAAALTSSIGGFAFSAICGAMLFHLDPDHVEVVQIMLVCSIGIQALSVWALRHSIDWLTLPPFLAGGVLGLPAGIALLLRSDHIVYTRSMGALLVLYGVYMILRRPIVIRRQNRLRDAIAGFLGGITGGAAAFPGAPVTVWCGMKGIDRDGQRAIYQPFILIMQLIALVAIHLTLHEGWNPAKGLADWIYLPAALLGASCGLSLYRCLSERQFFVAINILLIVAGASLAL